MNVSAILKGDRLALSRLLSQIEDETIEGQQLLGELYPYTGNAHYIGITGAPGTGKSTLVNQLAYYYRQPPAGEVPLKVAVVAVDPSSPFSGGAVLGDRVRMRAAQGDAGVFVRSMATRGTLGGLARATAGMVQALDAAGFEVILIETVGVGQAEVDILKLAHTTLVVEAPGLGDDIQAMKAGVLEAADILVVNKADKPEAAQTEKSLRSMLQMTRSQPGGWEIPLCKTIATSGTGVPELAIHISNHHQFIRQSGELSRKERERIQAELEELIRSRLYKDWYNTLSSDQFHRLLERVLNREISPYEAINIVFDGVNQK